MNRNQTMKVHSRRKYFILLALIVCAFLTGCACKHEWVEATCTEPKTCSKCGETEGEALGHNWGEWEVSVEATPGNIGLKARTCSRCAEEDTEVYEIERMFEDGHLLISPVDFCRNLGVKLYRYSLDVGLKGGDDEMMAIINALDSAHKEGDTLAIIAFSDGTNVLGVSDKDSCNIKAFTVRFITDEEDVIAQTIMGIVRVCDESVDETSAEEIEKEIMSAYQLDDVYHGDGINYGLIRVNGEYFLLVTID